MINKDYLSKLNQNEIKALSQDIVNRMESEGKTLKQVLGVEDSLLEEIYGLAYGHYDQGKYETAASLFFFLNGIAPDNFKYLFGLAASFYEKKDYINAAKGFMNALLVEPEDPMAAYYTADCFIELGNHEGALDFLDICIDSCGNKAEFAALKARCQLTKKTLKSNNK